MGSENDGEMGGWGGGEGGRWGGGIVLFLFIYIYLFICVVSREASLHLRFRGLSIDVHS